MSWQVATSRGRTLRTLPHGRIVIVPKGVTLADLIPAQDRDPLQVARNARAMRRVAAGLPACAVDGDECPLHKHEATGIGVPMASTTQDLSAEVHGGCCHDGTD